jgi:poly [ADP-ribose] polymerase 10/14/15
VDQEKKEEIDTKLINLNYIFIIYSVYLIKMNIRYVEMKEPIYEQISQRVRESFPNSCICWIEENQNNTLLEAYEKRKASNLKEVQWFHGTKEELITTIANNGFDPSYNKTSAYGKGTYFAKNASYSNSYMSPNKEGISFMFLCDVLMGNPCLGQSQLVIDTTKYHSAVDNIKTPSILVTPFADGAYPRYIIAFHKGAK